MKLASVRRVFARQMLTIAGASGDARLEDALACVPREKFLGPGRWRVMSPWSSQAYIDRDPALVYQDVVIGLDEERGVNNGSPSLHAHWMHLVSPREGETVVHIGAGTGYYSAILAELVGQKGRVTAVEFDGKSAEQAKDNLSYRDNVEVVNANGFEWPAEPVDVVYVNFATPRPAPPWIENLRTGGRLIFPLGVPGMARPASRPLNAQTFLVTRTKTGYAASAAGAVSFIYADGILPEPDEKELRTLQRRLRKGGWNNVESLIWNQPADGAECWYAGPSWALK